MNSIKLKMTIGYNKFVEEYNSFKSELNELKLKEVTNLEEYKDLINELNSRVSNFLIRSFNDDPTNYFVDRYNKSGQVHYLQPNLTLDSLKNTIQKKVTQIDYQLGLLSTCDVIKNPDDKKLIEERLQLEDIGDRFEFVLTKLLELKDYNDPDFKGHHSIDIIYWGNGLKMLLSTEGVQIRTMLKWTCRLN